MSRLTNDLFNLTELYHHFPENLVIYGTQFVGSLIILLIINWRLALVSCALLPVMAVYSFIFYRKLRIAYRQNRERIADVNARAEEREIERFTRENARFYASRSNIYKNEAIHFTVIENFFTQLITRASLSRV